MGRAPTPGSNRVVSPGDPDRFLPSTVPTSVSGSMTKRQMQATATMVPKGMAREAW